MRHSVKGVLAAAGAAAALVAGTGTLAFWTDSISVPGSTGINSGTMKLTDTTAGTCPSVGWVLDSLASPSGVAFDPATDYLVPGDVLTKTCTFSVAAQGTHLHATITPTAPTTSGTLAGSLTVGGTFQIAGVDVTDLTEANNGDTITAVLTVTYDPAAGNATQLTVADVTAYGVALTQTHA